MNEQMMNAMSSEGAWVMVCMIITTLFAFIIGISVIIQTFLQAKMLYHTRLG